MREKNYCATCHNLGSSSTIIMDNGNEYFKNKNILMSKNFHSPTCENLMDGWN